MAMGWYLHILAVFLTLFLLILLVVSSALMTLLLGGLLLLFGRDVSH
jgi:hypothetical protein